MQTETIFIILILGVLLSLLLIYINPDFGVKIISVLLFLILAYKIYVKQKK